MAGLARQFEGGQSYKPPLPAQYQQDVDPSQDPMALLQSILGGQDDTDYGALAQQQVGPAFDAQLANLALQENQARANSAKGQAQIGSMYKALANGIKADKKGIANQYNATAGDITNAMNDAVGGIQGIYGNSQQQLSDLMRGLGIQAAAPDVLKGGAQQEALLSGLARINGQAGLTATHENKGAALTFNDQQANIAGLTGANKQAQLVQNLNDQLNQFAQQRNSLEGQYQQQLAQTQYGLQEDAIKRQQDLYQILQDAENQSNTLANSQATQQRAENAQEYQQMGPYERGNYKAEQLFGSADAAKEAMDIVNETATRLNNGIYADPAHFVRSVLANAQNKVGNGGWPALDPNMLQALAQYYYANGGVGTKAPSYNDQLYGNG